MKKSFMWQEMFEKRVFLTFVKTTARFACKWWYLTKELRRPKMLALSTYTVIPFIL